MTNKYNDDGNKITLVTSSFYLKSTCNQNRTNLFKYEFLFSIKNHSLDCRRCRRHCHQTNNATLCCWCLCVHVQTEICLRALHSHGSTLFTIAIATLNLLWNELKIAMHFHSMLTCVANKCYSDFKIYRMVKPHWKTYVKLAKCLF